MVSRYSLTALSNCPASRYALARPNLTSGSSGISSATSLNCAMRSDSGMPLRLRHEGQRHRVHAVPRVLRGEALAEEDVTEAAAARRALDLDPLTVRIGKPL